jgi:hypothetical protein
MHHINSLESLDDFVNGDDLWVAARHAQLRSMVLDERLPKSDPRRVAAANLALAWAKVPLVLQYAIEGDRRGRNKTPSLMLALQSVIATEELVKTAGEVQISGIIDGRVIT